MIKFLFQRGGILYPADLLGRPLGKCIPSLAIHDRATLLRWWKRGTRRFIFAPRSAGLVAIDCDEKCGKHGIRELIKIIGSEPVFYVETPSGGRHYFFISDGRDYVSAEIRPGVEIKSRSFITLPGSRSDKGRYVQHGDPADITALPKALRDIMPIRSSEPRQIRRPEGDPLGLGRIADIIQRQGLQPVQGGRNRYAFEFARFSKKQGHQAEEVAGYLSFMAGQDFTTGEIRAAVKSAYQGGAR